MSHLFGSTEKAAVEVPEVCRVDNLSGHRFRNSGRVQVALDAGRSGNVGEKQKCDGDGNDSLAELHLEQPLVDEFFFQKKG